jgi:Tfp pilus assembly major pilin PilA
MVSKQKGITLMSFVMVLVVVGFFALMAMKLFPMYSEFHNMKSAVNEFAAQPNSASKAPAQAWADLERRFNIAYVESVKREHIKIERAAEGRGMVMRVSYEVRKPLMFNLDVVGKFEHEANLTGTGSGG